MGQSLLSLLRATPSPTRLYQAYVLLVLVVVYTFNFIDRIVLGILVAHDQAPNCISPIRS